MSTTPITDAMAETLAYGPDSPFAKPAVDKCRELEIKLEEAKAQHRLDMSEIRRQHQAEWDEHKSDEDLIAENKRLRHAIETNHDKECPMGWTYPQPPCNCWVERALTKEDSNTTPKASP